MSEPSKTTTIASILRLGRAAALVIVMGIGLFVMKSALAPSQSPSTSQTAAAGDETKRAAANDVAADEPMAPREERANQIPDLQRTLPKAPMPLVQTLNYWTGTHYTSISMRIRETSAPVTPDVEFRGKNRLERLRWEALVRTAWFGALFLYDGDPKKQVVFNVGNKTPQPEALVAMMVSTFAALHDRPWPNDLYLAGAITPDGRIVPPPRSTRVMAAAQSLGVDVLLRGELHALIGLPSVAMRPGPSVEQNYTPLLSTDALRTRMSAVISKLMAGQPTGLELPPAWEQRMQRLEGRYRATELQDLAAWFQLAVAGGQIRAAQAVTEFTAERLEPYALRLRRKAATTDLGENSRELNWFLALAQSRVLGERNVQHWTTQLPAEAYPGPRFTLRSEWLKRRLQSLRHFALAFRKGLVHRQRGSRHPFPYPAGELSLLSQSPDIELSGSMAVDWGYWLHRASLSWAHYVALITQQPKHTQSMDLMADLYGHNPDALRMLVQSTEERLESVMSELPTSPLKGLLSRFPAISLPPRDSIRSSLDSLERTYTRFLLATEGQRILDRQMIR